MNWRRGKVYLGALLAALLASASLAASSRATVIGLQFASKEPGTNSAMTLHIRYTKPGEPNAKPPPIRKIRIDAPAGAQFHSSKVPACKASDSEAMAMGPSACPSATRIGGGTVVVVTGFGPPFDPFPSPTPVFNDGKGWLEISQDSSEHTTIAVTRLTVTGSQIGGDIAAAPGGPPDGETAVSTVDFSFPVSTGYITTPPTCPPSGAWVTTGTFTFADGTTQIAQGDTPCTTARPAQIRVRLTPTRVRAGKRVRIRVALSSTDPRCVSHAAVRLRGPRRRTMRSTGSGRATIVARFRGRGRRTVAASNSGCRGGTASLAVLRRKKNGRR
jgi:hypothetical protein